ncbi:hypothetical protein SAMN05444365_103538 [Micromonospora pattaloongensis]|uniref:DUF7455 domain-containing protein n=1 Tax=Micromonospora pattaloongensis TaxID=405436 RepID=A0A1H3MV08_9ACTN|nr:hypothetical protein [Micromonospora pattaloongensis]SDY80552.1 hypothetical protein SAMN05444365_103538 [Micromonospora pattaloongensis]
MRPVLVPSLRVEVVASVPDSCDGCGAAARLSLQLTSGGELAFCGHHANRHAVRILGVARQVRVEDGFEWAGAKPAPR